MAFSLSYGSYPCHHHYNYYSSPRVLPLILRALPLFALNTSQLFQLLRAMFLRVLPMILEVPQAMCYESLRVLPSEGDSEGDLRALPLHI